MSQEKPSTLMTVVDQIERVCRAHVAIQDFDYGDVQSFDNKTYDYPLAYLETVQDLLENSNGSEQTYTIALNIVDLKGSAKPTATEYVALQDKLAQVFFEIKSVLQLDYFFSKERVGPADILIFPDFANTNAIRLRAEFPVMVESLDTETPDLAQIFPGLF